MSDLISRQAAIDALEEQLDYLQMLNKDENTKAESKWYGVNWARNTIADLPSPEPERKAGHWIQHPGGKFVGFPYMHYECDQCRDFEPEERNFCPNCGADMREREGE